MKKIVSLVLTVVMVFSITTMTAYASTPQNQDHISQSENELDVYYPLLDWTATSSIVHGVSISGTSGNVTVSYVASRGDYEVRAFYRLQRYVNGTWQTIYTSPTSSGVFSCYLHNMHTLTRGYQYRTQTVGKVYDSRGNYLETVTVESTPQMCY